MSELSNNEDYSSNIKDLKNIFGRFKGTRQDTETPAETKFTQSKYENETPLTTRKNTKTEREAYEENIIMSNYKLNHKKCSICGSKDISLITNNGLPEIHCSECSYIEKPIIPIIKSKVSDLKAKYPLLAKVKLFSRWLFVGIFCVQL